MEKVNFKEELYKVFGQVKDFSLGMRIAERFYEMGANAQREQMMKEMVITSYEQKDVMDGDVEYVLYDRIQKVTVVLDKVSNIHVGDKVKLIIIKED